MSRRACDELSLLSRVLFAVVVATWSARFQSDMPRGLLIASLNVLQLPASASAKQKYLSCIAAVAQARRRDDARSEAAERTSLQRMHQLRGAHQFAYLQDGCLLPLLAACALAFAVLLLVYLQTRARALMWEGDPKQRPGVVTVWAPLVAAFAALLLRCKSHPFGEFRPQLALPACSAALC